jgi:hypothetical protein
MDGKELRDIIGGPEQWVMKGRNAEPEGMYDTRKNY